MNSWNSWDVFGGSSVLRYQQSSLRTIVEQCPGPDPWLIGHVFCRGRLEPRRGLHGTSSCPGHLIFPKPEGRHGCGSKPMGSHFWGRRTTHFRTYFSGDWDVHWPHELEGICSLPDTIAFSSPFLGSSTPLQHRAVCHQLKISQSLGLQSGMLVFSPFTSATQMLG